MNLRDHLTQQSVAALTVLGLVAAFGGGFVAANVLTTPTAAGPTGAVASEGQIESDVSSFLDVVSGDRADITVDSVTKSDVNGMYEVQFTASVETPQGTQEQQSSVFVTPDGEYVFAAQPNDLQNPPEPRPMPQQPPQEAPQ